FHYTDAPRWIYSALTLVPSDSHEAGALLAQHGGFIGFLDGGYAEAERAFEAALAIAEREHDKGLEQRTFAVAAFVDAFHLRWKSCLTRGRAIAAPSSSADPDTEIQARRSMGWALAATGKLEEGKLHTAAALALAQRVRGTWWVTSASFSNELFCMYEGDWRTARKLSEVGLAADPRDPRHLGLRAVLEPELGDPEQTAAYVDRLEKFVANVAPPGPSAAYVFLANSIALTSGTVDDEARIETAKAAAADVLALPRLSPALGLYTRNALALIAERR